jgi:hypothetical protein
MKRAALYIARRGLAVFPLKPRDKIPLSYSHGCKDATCSPERIEAWWSKHPDANIGVATGKASDMFVLDIDMKHGKNGEASLQAIETKFGKLPATVEAITPSGGRHLYFKLPDFDGAPEVSNSVDKIGHGLDVRGTGGYVVAPPVIGKPYAWSVDSANAIAEVPVWFLSLLNPPVDLDQRRGNEHFRRIARGVTEGSRNQSAASLAGYLLRRGVDPQTALDLLIAWDAQNCTPPQGATVILTTVESILRREIERRSRSL